MMIYGAAKEAVSVAAKRTEYKDQLKCSFRWKNRKRFWLKSVRKMQKMEKENPPVMAPLLRNLMMLLCAHPTS